MNKSILSRVKTISMVLLTMIPMGLFAQKITPGALTDIVTGAVPEGALKLDKKDGYARTKAIVPDQLFTEEETVGEFYAKDNIIISFHAGKAKTPLKATELEERRAMKMEMAGIPSDRLYPNGDDPYKILAINNYKVLVTSFTTIPVYFYFLIGPDNVSCLNFSLTARPEDLEKARALGDAMLNNIKFK